MPAAHPPSPRAAHVAPAAASCSPWAASSSCVAWSAAATAALPRRSGSGRSTGWTTSRSQQHGGRRAGQLPDRGHRQPGGPRSDRPRRRWLPRRRPAATARTRSWCCGSTRRRSTGAHPVVPARPVPPDRRHREDGPDQHRPRPRRADADRHDPGELRHPDQPLRRDRLRRVRADRRRGRRRADVVRRPGARPPHRPRRRATPECQVLDGEQARKFVRSRYLAVPGRGRRLAHRPHRRPRPDHPPADLRAPRRSPRR